MKCGRSGSASRPGSRSGKLRGGEWPGEEEGLVSINLFRDQFSNRPFHIEAVCLSMKYLVENQLTIYVLDSTLFHLFVCLLLAKKTMALLSVLSGSASLPTWFIFRTVLAPFGLLHLWINFIISLSHFYKEAC